MTPAELETLLASLGWSWRTLADYLVRNERTVRRWKAGDAPVPPIVVRALHDDQRLAAFDLLLRLRREA